MNKLLSLPKHINKRITVIALLLICVAMLPLLTIPTAHAKDPTPEEVISDWQACYDLIDKKTEGSTMALIAWEVGTAATGFNPDYNLAAIGKNIYSIAAYDGVAIVPGASVSLISLAEKGYETFRVVGLILIFLYFLIELLDEVQADSFTVEHLIKKLITLAISIIVMQQGAVIFRYITALGEALMEEAQAGGQGGATDLALLKAILKSVDSGWLSFLYVTLTAVGIILQNVVSWALMLIVLLIAYLTSFSRLLEFVVRFAFAPIGIAQLVSGGAKGPGMRYIKKFASVILQGAVIVYVLAIIPSVRDAAGELGMFAQYIVPLTAIGFIMKVRGICDDIVGV